MQSPEKRNYEDLSIIGRGAYGTVFKAKDIDNGRVVALKRVRLVQSSEEKGVPVSTLREITLLKQLDNISHPNIVRVFDAFQCQSSTDNDMMLTIVFEHIDQDLSSFLHNYPPPGLSEPLIKDLMHQLLSGLDYLHVNRLVHRDIKPQNILITKNNQVKIADFGLARIYGFFKLVTSVVVTLWYRSPEVLLQCPYTTKVDMWSIGAIMVELYNRRPLFPGKSDIDQLHKILSVIGAPLREEWPEKVAIPHNTFTNYKRIDIQHLLPTVSHHAVGLIQNLLVFDPAKRYNTLACLSHEYFNGVTPITSYVTSSKIEPSKEELCKNTSIKKSRCLSLRMTDERAECSQEQKNSPIDRSLLTDKNDAIEQNDRNDVIEQNDKNDVNDQNDVMIDSGHFTDSEEFSECLETTECEVLTTHSGDFIECKEVMCDRNDEIVVKDETSTKNCESERLCCSDEETDSENEQEEIAKIKQSLMQFASQNENMNNNNNNIDVKATLPGGAQVKRALKRKYPVEV